MIALYRALRDLPAQFRAGTNLVLGRLDTAIGMMTFMNAKLDAIKAAEDKLGADIATAVATNKSNLDTIAELLAKQTAGSNTTEDDAKLDEILASAQAHAAALEEAFPAPKVDLSSKDSVGGAAGTDSVAGA